MKSESYCFIQCMPVEHQCLSLFCQVSLPSFSKFLFFGIKFFVFLFSSGSGIPTKYLFRSKTWIWQTKMLFWQWFGQFHLFSSTSFGHSGKVIILVLNYILDFKTSERSPWCVRFLQKTFLQSVIISVN